MGKDTLVKVTLIGDAKTGKSSILNRYTKSEFSEKYQPTLGVTFELKRYDDSTKDVDITRIQIWDTSGEDRYRAITSAYYRGANAIVICVDMTARASFESIQRWFDEAHSHTGNNEVLFVLAGTKSDLIDRQVVTPEELQARAKELKFPCIITSAKTGENIEAIFTEIILPNLPKEVDVLGTFSDPLGRAASSEDESRKSLVADFEMGDSDDSDEIVPAPRCRPGCCSIL